MARELRRQLRGRADHLVGSVARGVSIEPAGERSPFHWVRWGACPITRTLDPGRALAAFDQVLAEAALLPDGHLRLPGRSIVLADGRAVLLPPEAEDELLRFDRALRETGALVVDSRTTLFDAVAWRVVVPAYRLDHGLLLPLVAGERERAPERFVEPGRYPVAGLLESAESRRLSRRLVRSVGVHDTLSEATLTGIANFLQHSPWRRVPDWRPSVVMRSIESLCAS